MVNMNSPAAEGISREAAGELQSIAELMEGTLSQTVFDCLALTLTEAPVLAKAFHAYSLEYGLMEDEPLPSGILGRALDQAIAQLEAMDGEKHPQRVAS